MSFFLLLSYFFNVVGNLSTVQRSKPSGFLLLLHVLENLNRLLLNNNIIHQIESGSFNNMSSLILLRLKHNRLREIGQHTFKGCIVFHKLVESAHITPGRHHHSFNDLTALTTLDLSNNKLGGGSTAV